MKLTTVLLIATMVKVSAAGFAQRITFVKKDATLKQVFSAINKQTGYSILLSGQQAKSDQKIDANFVNAPVEDVLKTALENQPLDFTIEDKMIVIRDKEPTLFDKLKNALTPTQPPGDITGRVTNKAGEPLPGASIIVKRTKTGTLTEANGKFTLKNLQPIDTLLISFIGYKTLKLPLNAETNFSIVMEEATNSLDQVVVQAYGTTTQRTTTGDIGKVTAADIEKQPVMNILEAMQGKIAGLDVTQTNGYASAPFKVELRGRSSLGVNPQQSFPSDPLYIVDGVPLTVVEAGNSSYNGGSTGFIQNAGVTSPAGGQSPLFSLSPSDIESIEVLKDADATAIYGSRGAQGVILITTKKGKAGKTKFDIDIQEGVTAVTRYYDMLNSQQYLAMRLDAFKNDGIAPDPVVDFDVNGTWNTNSYTNWQKALYGNVGQTLDARTSISGGDLLNTFRIGADYDHTTNITTVSGGDQRASLSFNLTHHSNNQRLSISLGANYAYTLSNMISLPGAITLAPDAPQIYNASGGLNYAGWGGNTNNLNARGAYPFAGLDQPYSSTTNFLTSDLVIGYQILKGLKISTNIGYNNTQANQVQLFPIASQDQLQEPTGASQLGNNNNKNWIIEPQATFDALIGKGKLNVLLGASAQQNNTGGLSVIGTGYTSDLFVNNIASAPSVTVFNSYGEYRYAAIFARIGYNWDGKYILNLTARRDGSSRFGPGKQYGNFGSAGAAWIFTEENWLKDKLSFLSFGKIRGSYGITGSDGVGDYEYLTRYSSNNQQPYEGITSYVPTQHANPNFQWQLNKKLEFAVELGFLKDWININASYYNDRTGNQLVQFPTPTFTGFTNVTANSPALVQNTGLEFTANAKIIDNKNFSWSMNFNLAINRNKLVSYPNFNLSPFVGTYVVGQPLNTVWLLHYTGVDPQTGQYTFYDKNHNGTIDVSYYNPGTGDDRYPYDLSPKYFGGFGSNFRFQSLTLSLFLSYKKQIGINGAYYGNTPGAVNTNQPVGVLAAWQNPGDIATVARFTTGYGNANSDGDFTHTSEGGYSDASFIRLSNLSLSYNIPDQYAKKLGMTGCSIFVHANNLFVITPFKGIDPETLNFGGLPPIRTIVGGVNFNF